MKLYPRGLRCESVVFKSYRRIYTNSKKGYSYNTLWMNICRTEVYTDTDVKICLCNYRKYRFNKIAIIWPWPEPVVFYWRRLNQHSNSVVMTHCAALVGATHPIPHPLESASFPCSWRFLLREPSTYPIPGFVHPLVFSL